MSPNNQHIQSNPENNIRTHGLLDASRAGDPAQSPAAALQEEQSVMLSQIISSLNEAQKACEAELRALGRSEGDCPCHETSPELYAELLRRLLSLEQIVYAYGSSTHYDRREVRNYIRHSNSGPDSLVAVHTSQEQVLIFLPYLPKRNRAKHAPVNEILAAEIPFHRFPKWSRWSASFTHLYPATTRNIPKDVDNYDYKRTIDLLAYALGTSDNALNYSMSMQTVFSDILPPGVYIQLLPKSSDKDSICALEPFLKLRNKE